MKKLFLLLPLLVILLFSSCSKDQNKKPKVLVFSKTMGFKHASIPKGIAAIQKLGTENNFEVDTTKNAEKFSDESLKNYAAVIFLSTTGDVLDAHQEAAFERYIQSGGGFVGIHAATDTEYDWKWYGRLVGAYFTSHPKTQEADFIIKDKDFPATSFFKDSIWHRTDELYNFKDISPDINVLISIDEKSYEGGINGSNHPMSWYHDYDGGRSFYTELGHTDESYSDETYLKHLLGGIEYAIDDNKELDYDKATTQFAPDADRFTKVQLSQGEFFEPTEMTILPNLDILVAQRRGGIMLYKNDTQKVSQVGFLDVYCKTLHTPGVNAEEGVMGLQKDPDFEKNHWVYVYYSPTGNKSINRLSRFKFENDVFDKASEEKILEIDTQREICCHTGGSIAFGPDKLLYLSTGDNSTPFDEKDVKYVNSGYAPLNDIPGHRQFDARRSAGNTNDLRGKILRIKVNEDGTYDIPQGNLFAEGTAKTRPEIYTMGHRNPYRISVDQKNSFLYWGEVGPDANNDSLQTRGPRGYDEVNQAQKAGNYGWPLFIGNNIPYRQYDYSTGESGEAFNPEKPMNNSQNNTGLTELPPAHSAYIWYPYTASAEFPQLGQGGRNAMAGPVYYNDMFPKETALPEYYNGKLIIYDWMRGWMKAVTLQPNGDFDKMEPFAPDVKLNSLIDMEVGPDGKIYLLEYGSGWFSQNADSGLARIDYNGGNRPPLVEGIEVDKTSGSIPLKIKATVTARDREKDEVTYLWDLGNNETKETKNPEIEYTYNDAGEYRVSVTVKDSKGESAQSDVVTVFAGNERPTVSIEIDGGNKSIFMPGVPVKYDVSVKDKEDANNIDPTNIFVAVDYVEGTDGASQSLGHQEVAATIMGKTLTQTLDCRSCHKMNEKSVGPAYMDVSKRYKDKKDIYDYLSHKIVEGGAGAWGEVMMPAHPNLSETDTKQIIAYIMSLASDNAQIKSLPASGSITPPADASGKVMVLTASYTDRGAENSKSLTGSTQLTIPSNTISFTEDTKAEGFTAMNYGGQNLLLLPADSGWFSIPDFDLTGIKQANVAMSWQGEIKNGFDFEVHLDSPDGKLIGKGSMKTPGAQQTDGVAPITIEPVTDGKSHTIYFTYKSPENKTATESPAAVTSVKFDGK
ncbi:MAG: ThuA domain-containing protein [Leeuwenhoekiella sp.]